MLVIAIFAVLYLGLLRPGNWLFTQLTVPINQHIEQRPGYVLISVFQSETGTLQA